MTNFNKHVTPELVAEMMVAVCSHSACKDCMISELCDASGYKPSDGWAEFWLEWLKEECE